MEGCAEKSLIQEFDVSGSVAYLLCLTGRNQRLCGEGVSVSTLIWFPTAL